MKIQFDTVTTGTDASGDPVTLSAAQIAAITYNILIDTVTPPVKSYQVPQKLIDNAPVNANGSKHVSVDAVKDLGLTLTSGVTYYLEMTDNLGNSVSQPTQILSDLLVITPDKVANFSVA